MAEAGGRKRTGRKAKAREPDQDVPKFNIDSPPKLVSPTARLAAMTRERIVGLEQERDWHREKVERLQAERNRLAPENARLREALSNAEANNLVSTVLIVVGGGIISYATFTGRIGQRLADIGCGALLAGVFLMLIRNFRWKLAIERN